MLTQSCIFTATQNWRRNAVKKLGFFLTDDGSAAAKMDGQFISIISNDHFIASLVLETAV